MTPRLAARLAIAFVTALSAPRVVRANQFVIVDVTYTHSATTTTDSHYRVMPPTGTPTNWQSPVDYATGGTAYVRLEVFTKPSAARTRFQICFEATPSYACTDQAPIYTTTGVYTWATPFPRFYQYADVDWTRGVRTIALILKDDMNRKPSPENVGAEISAMYMPTRLRVTVTIVSAGGTYVPPGAMDAGVVDAGPVRDAASDAAHDGATDAHATDVPSFDAVTIESGVDAWDDVAPDSFADAGQDTGTRADRVVADASGDAGDAGHGAGCGCATAGGDTGSHAALATVIALGLGRRRRRRRAVA